MDPKEVKSQFVRLMDVYALGPYMLTAARFVKNKPFRVGLVFLGVATMLYNGRNYQRLKEGQQNESGQ